VIRVSVMYPKSEGSTFDRQYYLSSHMPMAREALKSALVKDEIWSGLSVPGAPPAAYEVVLHMYFDNLEVLSVAFQEHSAGLMEDLPNFTNIRPVIELEEVVSAP
jgi:uncharacterized protein (TIGR02118 family)